MPNFEGRRAFIEAFMSGMCGPEHLRGRSWQDEWMMRLRITKTWDAMNA